MTDMKYRLLSFILLFSLLYSCDPLDIPVPEDENPLFESTFTLDGIVHEFQAGISDYIMFNDFFKDSLGIQTFVSRFEQENCDSDCVPTLEIQIRDRSVYNPTDFDINSSLSLDSYKYLDANDLPFLEQLLINGAYVGTAPSSLVEYSWNLNNAGIGQNQGTLTYDIVNDELLSVCLSAYDPDVDCLVLNCGLFSPFGKAECYMNLQVSTNPNGFVSIEALGFGQGNLRYRFQGGDYSPISTFQFIPQSNTSILVEMQNENGYTCQSSACFIVAQDSSDLSYSTIDMEYEFVGDTIAVNKFSEVSFIYTDESGVVFRSDLTEQSNQSKFLIEQFMDYVHNDFGSPTKQVNISFDVLLENESGKQIHIENGKGTIAIAYPE